MGTLLYISPEQVRGGTPDARSDIYSLGVVLYELLTRTPPHTGENIVQLAMAISNDDVHPPSALSPGLPPELDRIVCKALEKDVSRRYQTSRALLDDLRTLRQELEFENKLVRTSTPVLAHQRTELLSVPLASRTSSVIDLWKTRPWIRWVSVSVIVIAVLATALLFLRRNPFALGRIDSVAVMPFTNATGNADNAYLSDGIAESIIDSLSQLPELHVLARSTTFRDQLRAMDPLAVGRDLKVEGVVTGHVRQRGDTIIVRASLVDVRNGTNVWGEQYEGKVTNVLALQQTMAQEISRKLRMQLTGEEKELLARRTSVNPEAFQSYLKGRYQLYKYTEESIRKSIELFNRCIEIDPTYPLPYAGLADAYYGLSNIYLSPHEAMPRAREAAGRALQLDESLAQAHTALAMVLVWYDWDFARGEAEFRRAIALEPDDAEAHRQYNTFLTAVGRFDEALAIGRKAIERDALSVPASYALARTYYFAGRYAEAKQQLRATSELNDRFAQVYNLEALIALNEGRPADAVERVNQALAVGGRTPLYLSTWGYVHARLGDREAAVKAMTELKSRVTYIPPVVLARLHTALGENDEAIRLLDQSVKDRSESIVWMKVDPSFAPLQKDPRYGELLKRVGF
jgi:TolB-like protein/Tfp pilus assembly protein PilF